MNTTPLTEQRVQEIAVAFKKLHELSQSKIVTGPPQDAERAALTNFLRDAAVAHLPEFIGCWQAVRREYEPLVNAVAIFLNRVSTFSGQQQPAPQAEKSPR